MIADYLCPFVSYTRNCVLIRIQKPKGSDLLTVETGVCPRKVETHTPSLGMTANASHTRGSNLDKIKSEP